MLRPFLVIFHQLHFFCKINSHLSAKKISSLRQDMPRRSRRRRSRRRRSRRQKKSLRRSLDKARRLLKELSNKRLGVLSRSAIDGMSAAQQSAFFEYLYTGFVVNRWLQGVENPLYTLPDDYEDMSVAKKSEFREKSWFQYGKSEKESESYSKVLFSCFEKAPLIPKGLQLYRGLRTTHGAVAHLRPGDRLRFMEYGFVSTTKREEMAFFFASMQVFPFVFLPDFIRRANPFARQIKFGILIKFVIGKGIKGIDVPTEFDLAWTPDPEKNVLWPTFDDKGRVTGSRSALEWLDQDEVILPPGYVYTLKAIRTITKANRNRFITRTREMFGLKESFDSFKEWTVQVDLPARREVQMRRLLPCTQDETLAARNTTIKFGRNLKTLDCDDGEAMRDILLATL